MTDSIFVIASSHDMGVYVCQEFAETIGKFAKIKVDIKLEVDFLKDLSILQSSGSFGTKLSGWEHRHIVFMNDGFIGTYNDLIKFAGSKYGVQYDLPASSMKKIMDESIAQTDLLLTQRGHPFAYLSFSTLPAGSDKKLSGTQFGKVIIELFEDVCPKAVDNFMRLCRGNEKKQNLEMKYLNSPIHRIVPDGWISCGDIIDGSGTNSVSIFEDQYFEDESFAIDFASTIGGIVGAAAADEPHKNGSQFFITTGPCEWLNFKMVGFGRVVQGYDVIKHIGSVPLSKDKPATPIFISSCGIIKD